mmetsp:Transcript_24732/g.50151  ORF Transcript_24732/g.50151 Transcript_24732/m.50151 type:complete len:329 (-) Transcript_24732:545-1531(-)
MGSASVVVKYQIAPYGRRRRRRRSRRRRRGGSPRTGRRFRLLAPLHHDLQGRGAHRFRDGRRSRGFAPVPPRRHRVHAQFRTRAQHLRTALPQDVHRHPHERHEAIRGEHESPDRGGHVRKDRRSVPIGRPEGGERTDGRPGQVHLQPPRHRPRHHASDPESGGVGKSRHVPPRRGYHHRRHGRRQRRGRRQGRRVRLHRPRLGPGPARQRGGTGPPFRLPRPGRSAARTSGGRAVHPRLGRNPGSRSRRRGRQSVEHRATLGVLRRTAPGGATERHAEGVSGEVVGIPDEGEGCGRGRIAERRGISGFESRAAVGGAGAAAAHGGGT